jgi:hypothetical protein
MDGFINVVRDKHHGFSRPLPDVEQKTLHLEAGVDVQLVLKVTISTLCKINHLW